MLAVGQGSVGLPLLPVTVVDSNLSVLSLFKANVFVKFDKAGPGVSLMETSFGIRQ